jgi:hypothetical protein
MRKVVSNLNLKLNLLLHLVEGREYYRTTTAGSSAELQQQGVVQNYNSRE